MGLKYAISTWIYGGEQLGKSLARLQTFGYDAVELPVMDPREMNTTSIKRMVEDYGLVVSNLLGNWAWSEKRDLCNKDKAVRERAVEYLKECVELVKEFDALSFAVLPSAVGKPGPIASLEDEWKWAVDSVAEGAEYAEELGVFVALEAANRYEVYMLNTVRDALRFARDVGSPAVRVLLDCFHMNIEEPDLPLAFHRAGDLMVNVHIADSNRQTVGKGHTDFRAIVRVLTEIGYPYYLTLEPLSEGADPTDLSSGFTPSERLLDADAELGITLLRLYEQVA